MPRILYQMEHFALPCVAGRVVAEMIAQKRPVIVGCDFERQLGGAQRGESPVPVNTIYRVMKKAFTSRSAVVGGVGVAHQGEEVLRVECDGNEVCTETAYNAYERSVQSITRYATRV